MEKEKGEHNIMLIRKIESLEHFLGKNADGFYFDVIFYFFSNLVKFNLRNLIVLF